MQQAYIITTIHFAQLVQVTFELSGDVALAQSAMMRGDQDSLERYFRLKWTSAEDEILQVVFLQSVIK